MIALGILHGRIVDCLPPASISISLQTDLYKFSDKPSFELWAIKGFIRQTVSVRRECWS